MKLGMQIGLGPGHIVLDGVPAPPSPKRGGYPLPNFWPMSIVAKQLHGWIKTTLSMEMGLGPGHIVLDGGQAAFLVSY